MDNSKPIIKVVCVLVLIAVSGFASAQTIAYTHADSLRGSINAERAWWDLLHYNLKVAFNPADSSISGSNTIRYNVLASSNRMQIDLMKPMIIDSIVQFGKKLTFERDGDAFFITLDKLSIPGSISSIAIYYHGRPRIAVRPPWDGGLIWSKDNKERPWITIACQGLGASVWFPCKDHQADEPDSIRFTVSAPAGLVSIANGKSFGKTGSVSEWVVRNPINNYTIIPYIGNYVSATRHVAGEKGDLLVTRWLLDYDVTTPITHHLDENISKTLKHLEYWFGPYPFYEDGYSLIEAPHLGMEHQSAIAYGNHFQNGYLGQDLSGTGWGLKWDFIVVHESAHEWFGNNITTKDIADMWVHESFANYSETLFTTSEYGVEAGNDYVIGCRQHIQNDSPIIGPYGVNKEGSGDMYYKGGNMIHMIRQIINDDEKFRHILRGLNKDFYHRTVTTAEIESYISNKTGMDFSNVFNQYLRTVQIPVLSYYVQQEKGGPVLNYTWTNCIDGFDMPVKVTLSKGKTTWLRPKTTTQKTKLSENPLPEKIVDRNFYVTEKRVVQN